MRLALDAARGRRLEPEPLGGDAPAAAFADAVRAFVEPLESTLDLLPVLVEEVNQDVGCLAVG